MYETNSIAQRICISVEHEKRRMGSLCLFHSGRGHHCRLSRVCRNGRRNITLPGKGFLQFLQLRKYQKESKGIYTFLTLPMKGTQVANAFLLQSLAMVFLYYALWLMVIVVMYFPMMHWMVSLAAKQEFLMDDGTILTGIDATRHNGLFLAFLRSEFLGIVYSLDWKNMMCALFLLFFAGVWIVSVSMQRAIGLTGIFICAAGLMIPLALYLQGHSAGEMSNILLTGSILLLAVGVWLIFRLQADFREPLAK